MFKRKFHAVEILLLILILLLFGYFRLKPIWLQTVPYTFDQGRDFLKAAEMVNDGNITFIGPTTGIQGVFHGVWWYYGLSIPYAIFSGNPSGFYYFIFFVSLFTNLLFYVFLRKEFGVLAGLVFLSIISTSPYFIRTAIFPINSVLVLPFILLLIFAICRHFQHKGSSLSSFLTLLSIGFVLEFELAFGFLLLPAFFLTMFLTKQLGAFFGSKQRLMAGMAGLAIPIIPRLLFELRNNFLQTKTLINFLQNPTATNAISIKGALLDRINLFRGFFTQLFTEFPDDALPYILLMVGILVVISARKMKVMHWRIMTFTALLGLSIFLVSLINKNNFFWGNYLEGFPYIYVFLISVILFYINEKGPPLLRFIPLLVLGYFLVSGVVHGYTEYHTKTTAPLEGLRIHNKIIGYLHNQVDNNQFCLRIYTPPVLAHTYNYIIEQHIRTRQLRRPSDVFYKSECWYIIERDDYLERAADWRAAHVPRSAEKVRQEKFGNNVTIELWKEK